MAVTLGKSPIIMTANGDEILPDGRNWKVSTYRFICTTSGRAIVYDKNGGRKLWDSGAQTAPATEETTMASDAWADGFYLSLTGAGEVHIYYA